MLPSSRMTAKTISLLAHVYISVSRFSRTHYFVVCHIDSEIFDWDFYVKALPCKRAHMVSEAKDKPLTIVSSCKILNGNVSSWQLESRVQLMSIGQVHFMHMPNIICVRAYLCDIQHWVTGDWGDLYLYMLQLVIS